MISNINNDDDAKIVYVGEEEVTDQVCEEVTEEVTEEPEQIFTKKEIENYIRQQEKSIFKNANDEFLWAKTQKKNCSKCLLEKRLCDFNGNTSGCDAFDKNGYRLRRPECNACTKNVSKGKTEAKKKPRN